MRHQEKILTIFHKEKRSLMRIGRRLPSCYKEMSCIKNHSLHDKFRRLLTKYEKRQELLCFNRLRLLYRYLWEKNMGLCCYHKSISIAIIHYPLHIYTILRAEI